MNLLNAVAKGKIGVINSAVPMPRMPRIAGTMIVSTYLRVGYAATVAKQTASAPVSRP